ncbi:hypothetical protein K461DRAFT_269810 [Myriangium duriaei CBS 260.36]|uniref:Extracellular membrane protein CFEM domain-containing protein n=1 Tax=Myriangium duriaei CBS 260.36 TaxID=1168546 RepID=A0A9P4MEU4_9PEZI|nr:hypothetical protein K461DRAFT_269810 [Myriangium duriaei CBS 260.36]
MLFSSSLAVLFTAFSSAVLAIPQQQCNTTDVNIIKTSFKHDQKDVCRWYLSQAHNGTCSPVPQLSSQAFSNACQCYTGKTQSTHAGASTHKPEAIHKCRKELEKLLSKQVSEVKGFCNWWTESPKRATSPLNAISAISIYEACACVSPSNATTSSTISSTTSTSATVSSISTPSIAQKDHRRKKPKHTHSASEIHTTRAIPSTTRTTHASFGATHSSSVHARPAQTSKSVPQKPHHDKKPRSSSSFHVSTTKPAAPQTTAHVPVSSYTPPHVSSSTASHHTSTLSSLHKKKHRKSTTTASYTSTSTAAASNTTTPVPAGTSAAPEVQTTTEASSSSKKHKHKKTSSYSVSTSTSTVTLTVTTSASSSSDVYETATVTITTTSTITSSTATATDATA